MSELDISSPFIKYKLNEQEILQGSILSPLQKMVIQNQIAQAAEERIALVFSPENLQRDAELQGTLGALKYLIAVSEEMEKISASQSQLL